MDVNSQNITAIQTGGTIDKDYPRVTGGYAFEISDPATFRVFHRAKIAFAVEQITLCKKDSQEITDNDREGLVNLCQKTQTSKILITHGTDTMIETAAFLAINSSNQLTSKTIVLTGALKPETFKDSDADFNVGVAVGALQCISKPGVYVAMTGRVYPWDCVSRDMQSGQFVQKVI